MVAIRQTGEIAQGSNHNLRAKQDNISPRTEVSVLTTNGPCSFITPTDTLNGPLSAFQMTSGLDLQVKKNILNKGLDLV